MYVNIPDFPSPYIYESKINVRKICFNNSFINIEELAHNVFIVHNLKGKYVKLFDVNGKLIHQIKISDTAKYCFLECRENTLFLSTENYKRIKL